MSTGFTQHCGFSHSSRASIPLEMLHISGTWDWPRHYVDALPDHNLYPPSTKTLLFNMPHCSDPFLLIQTPTSPHFKFPNHSLCSQLVKNLPQSKSLRACLIIKSSPEVIHHLEFIIKRNLFSLPWSPPSARGGVGSAEQCCT